MNVSELLMPDGRPSGVFVCGKCKCLSNDKAAKGRCCTPQVCKLCGEPMDGPNDLPPHRECMDRQRVERATKLDEWDGPVYLEGGWNDGYFNDLDSLCEYLHDEHGDDYEAWPEYVFVVKEEPFRGLRTGTLVEMVTEDWPDEMHDNDRLKGVNELDAAVKAFNEANKANVTWLWDHTRMVRVPRGSVVEATA